MEKLDRRTFLASLVRAGAATAALEALPPWARAAAAATAPAAELLVRNAWPEHFETTLGALAHGWITSNERFFVRSHFPAPTIEVNEWRLEVGGLSRAPLTLSLADLRAMPQVEATHTLECAGNGRGLFKLPSTSGTQWERGAVGNAAWGGIRLEALLRRAEVPPEAKHVWFETADKGPLPVPRFVRSIPIEKAMSDVLLATTMNGAPLPHLHGAPMRVIVPGWYGMASSKWVTKVRLEAAPSDNHFMAKGYRYSYPGADPAATPPPVEEMRVKSVIVRPLEGARVAVGKIRVQGFAWTGHAAGVKTVEISSDGGKTWKPAGFMGETAPMAWRLWATEIDAKAPARLTVMARATDGAGEVQPVEARANGAGYANNSIHVVAFRVA